MALKFDIAGSQIDGSRDYQEDAFLITNLSDNDGNPSALIVVADGMGGHAAGNVASNMAVQAFNKHITSNYPTEDCSEILNQSVLKANASIAETIKETPALDGMGCTMVSAILEKGLLWWASVGDSHIYLLRDRELKKINADHSYGGFLDRMEAAGTPAEPEPGLSRNMLMSAVTGADISDIDCPTTPLELQDGDKLVICSDGLDTLSSGKIIQYTDWADSPKEGADGLLNAVEEANMPKQDNTTVVVISVTESDKAVIEEAPEDEDDDDGDITDPSGKSLSGTTPLTDMPEETPEPEPEPEPEPVAAPEPVPETHFEATQEGTKESAIAADTGEKKGGKTTLIIGIAAGVIILAGVAFFLLGGDKKADVVSTDITVSEDTDTDVEEEIELDAEEETESIDLPDTETETETAAVTETEVETETSTSEKPAAEAPVEEKPVAAKAEPPSGEFQDDLKSGGKGPSMVWIPAGSFEMGSPGSSGKVDERPRHTVKVNQFAISKTEITFTEYELFAKSTGRKIPDNLYMDKDTHPVLYVSWDDAYYYAKWLSEQTGNQYRLPTEAEWEYAASGGSKTPFWWGFKEEPNRAHCLGCGSAFNPRQPAKVGSFKPNQYGIYDTAGNIAEWVHDCWHEDYNGAPSEANVWEGGDCSLRIVRGGSYNSPPQSIRIAKRDKLKSDSGYDIVGIRIVRDPD